MDYPDYGAPEDFMAVQPIEGIGLHIDAIHTAISRADAVLLLLAASFENFEEGPRFSGPVVDSAICAVRGNLQQLKTLFNCAWQVERDRRRSEGLAQPHPVAGDPGGRE